MRLIRKLSLFIIILGFAWFFYGDIYEDAGVSGVVGKIQRDLGRLAESPLVQRGKELGKEGLDKLSDAWQIEENAENQKNVPAPELEKPELDTPTEEAFSVHNIEIGDSQDKVEELAGKPKRSTLNEYGVDWVSYHEEYQQFFMVAYDTNQRVAGLYTNQDLITSTYSLKWGTPKNEVKQQLPTPLEGIKKGRVRYRVKNDGEFDSFLIDDHYVTLFYDKHQHNTVKAIQIISNELEAQKEGMFGTASKALEEGLMYQLFDVTNAERVQHRLPVLSWDEAVSNTAHRHSADMAENQFFNHTNLDGLSPSERIQRDGLQVQGVGENIAAGQMSSIFAHEGLMNSLGHRENILHPDYEGLGIGIAFGENNLPYYTENFVIR